MPKETLRDKVKRLEDSQVSLNKIIEFKDKENHKLINELNAVLKEENLVSINDYNAVLNSQEYYKSLFEEYKGLYEREKTRNEQKSKKMDKLIDENNRIQKLINENKKIKNERGAGRKSIITKDLIDAVCESRKNGRTFAYIASELNISVGLAHNIAKQSQVNS